MEELLALARRLRSGDGGDLERVRIRELLASVHPPVLAMAWEQVEDLMLYALGLYAFGRLGYAAAEREAAAQG